MLRDSGFPSKDPEDAYRVDLWQCQVLYAQASLLPCEWLVLLYDVINDLLRILESLLTSTPDDSPWVGLVCGPATKHGRSDYPCTISMHAGMDAHACPLPKAL